MTIQNHFSINSPICFSDNFLLALNKEMKNQNKRTFFEKVISYESHLMAAIVKSTSGQLYVVSVSFKNDCHNNDRVISASFNSVSKINNKRKPFSLLFNGEPLKNLKTVFFNTNELKQKYIYDANLSDVVCLA